MRSFSAILPVSLQVTATAIACAALALWPPSSGKLLLVAVGDRDVGHVVRIALAAHAALLGPGPFPGSLVVVGTRSDLARQIRSWNVILMAAPPSGCGGVGSPA